VVTKVRLAQLKDDHSALLRRSLVRGGHSSSPVGDKSKWRAFVLDRVASHVDIAVKGTFDSFVARLEDFDVAITLDPESGRVESTAFHADLAAVKTGRADRDHNMSVWLQTNEFPQVVFELRAVDRFPNGALIARGRLHYMANRTTYVSL